MHAVVYEHAVLCNKGIYYAYYLTCDHMTIYTTARNTSGAKRGSYGHELCERAHDHERTAGPPCDALNSMALCACAVRLQRRSHAADGRSCAFAAAVAVECSRRRAAAAARRGACSAGPLALASMLLLALASAMHLSCLNNFND